MKVLILSIGSLLGQGLLDCLASRRSYLEVIGINSVADNPCNFKADRVYLSPQLNQPDFQEYFLELVKREKPTLILPGRDDDVLFLAQFRQEQPDFAEAIPCGFASIAAIMRDKYDSWQWANQRHLPFAASFLYHPGEIQELETFIQQVGFPQIAKPRQGQGSQGIYFVQNQADIERLANQQPLFLQAYLGPKEELEPYFRQYTRGMPLHFQIPERLQFAAQTLIGPDGQQGASFCSQSTLIMGRTERFQQIHVPELESLLLKYTQALAIAGWRGPVNLQAKPDQNGEWQAFELNLRMSGGTASRLSLGFDEIGNLMQAFLPEFDFPCLTRAEVPAIIYPCFQNQTVFRSDLEQLQAHGHWSVTQTDRGSEAK